MTFIWGCLTKSERAKNISKHQKMCVNGAKVTGVKPAKQLQNLLNQLQTVYHPHTIYPIANFRHNLILKI